MMPPEHVLSITHRAHRLVDDAVVFADAWRLQGRWSNALALLSALKPVIADLDIEHQAAHALTTARVLTEQAGFGGFVTLAERSTSLDLALSLARKTQNAALLGAVWDARGMSLHYTFLDSDRTVEPPEELSSFQQALDYYQQAHDQRGIAETLFHIGLVYGVVRQNHAQAMPFFQQSYDIARAIPDAVIASYAIRHISFAQYNAGQLDAAQVSLHESLALREQAGFVPGIAMALVALAYADAELYQRATALDHLTRAKAIFQQLGAENKVAWVEQLIAEFQQQQPSM